VNPAGGCWTGQNAWQGSCGAPLPRQWPVFRQLVSNEPVMGSAGDRRVMLARDPLHIPEQIVQRLIGDIGHFGEGTQKTVGPR
jgi:hypothetical protein